MIPSRKNDPRMAKNAAYLYERYADALTERERSVICRMFGLEGVTPQTYDLAAKDFGLSRERIRQIMVTAYAKLKTANTDERFGAVGVVRHKPKGFRYWVQDEIYGVRRELPPERFKHPWAYVRGIHEHHEHRDAALDALESALAL